VGQITALAGCDLLTISPELLTQLAQSNDALHLALDAKLAQGLELEEIQYTESEFRLAFNEDAMGVEKLAEGIRAFNADIVKLESLIRSLA
jgi:transaldolase